MVCPEGESRHAGAKVYNGYNASAKPVRGVARRGHHHGSGRPSKWRDMAYLTPDLRPPSKICYRRELGAWRSSRTLSTGPRLHRYFAKKPQPEPVARRSPDVYDVLIGGADLRVSALPPRTEKNSTTSPLTRGDPVAPCKYPARSW